MNTDDTTEIPVADRFSFSEPCYDGRIFSIESDPESVEVISENEILREYCNTVDDREVPDSVKSEMKQIVQENFRLIKLSLDLMELTYVRAKSKTL